MVPTSKVFDMSSSNKRFFKVPGQLISPGVCGLSGAAFVLTTLTTQIP